jgi:multimeric flavodoxin WrbA
MRIIGINGSPRKSWNTHILVTEALTGAAAAGVETELISFPLDRIRAFGMGGNLACE